MTTLTYTDIKFAFPPTDPNHCSPYADYYNLALDSSKPWLRADILVNDIKRHTIAHTELSSDKRAITVKPVEPYPCFGIQVDSQVVYAQMYVYEATLRVYHESMYLQDDVETWVVRSRCVYRD